MSVYEVSWICNFPEEGSNGHELASLASSLNVNRLSDTHATTCQIGTVAGEPELRRNYCVLCTGTAERRPLFQILYCMYELYCVLWHGGQIGWSRKVHDPRIFLMR